MQEKSKLFRLVTLILVLAMLTFVATSCASGETTGTTTTEAPSSTTEGESEDTPVNIRLAWWGGEARAAATQEIAELWVDQNPHWNIEVEPGAWDNYWQRMVIQISSQNMPDICQLDWQFASEILNLGKPFVNLYDYSDVLDTDDLLEFNTIYTGTPDYMFGLPIAANAKGLVAGVPFIEKWDLDPDKRTYTWEELAEIGAEINAQDPESYLLYLHQDFFWILFMDTMIGRLGTQAIEDDFTMNITAEDVEGFFDWYLNLQEIGVLCPMSLLSAHGGSTAEQIPEWHNGSIGMTVGYTSNFTTAIPGTDYELIALDIPYEENAKVRTNAFVPATLWGVSVYSDYIDECLEFVNWFLNDAEAGRINGTTRGIPSNKNVRESLLEAGEFYPQLNEIFTMAGQYESEAYSAISSNAELKTIIVEHIERVGFKQQTPAEAAESFISATQEFLDSRN